jgi:NAD(P)-dependent dehydrogenase (short-subunit alcohol dehydrogenase family)
MSRSIVVTGAASGIGEAITTLLLQGGNHVTAMDLDTKALEAASERSWTAYGKHLSLSQGDVTQAGDVERTLHGAHARTGRIDVIVNNAGIAGGPQALKLHQTSIEDFDQVWAVNGRGVFLMCRTALTLMLAQGGGVIVNIASVAGMVAFPERSAYSISKGAVVMLTKSIAVDYAGQGIRCNAVCPGMIDTPMTHWRLQQPELRASVVSRIPQGEVGGVMDVAHAVEFLASPQAGYLNGSTLVVDGAYSSI